MAQQARAESTRRVILAAAADLINEVGYASAGLAEVIERTELSKGAFYYHFNSKEALAEAIIGEASKRVSAAFERLTESTAPALESLIHSSFVLGGLLTDDVVVRSGAHLMRALSGFSKAADIAYAGLQQLITDQTRRAIAEGDLRDDSDPAALGELLVSAYLGAHLLSITTTTGSDLCERLARGWQILLPTIADDAALPYLHEFLDRETLRGPVVQLAGDQG